jgi:hypothetical protein
VGSDLLVALVREDEGDVAERWIVEQVLEVVDERIRRSSVAIDCSPPPTSTSPSPSRPELLQLTT